MKLLKSATQQCVLFLLICFSVSAVYAEDMHRQHKHDSHTKNDGKKMQKMSQEAASQESVSQDSLMVHHGWIRLTPPVSKNSAAYFVLHNAGKKDVKIVDVVTPAAEMAMMHDSVIEMSMVRMVHLEELSIPAGGTVEFATGGKHLMLVNLTGKLEAGKEIPVTFKLDNGESVLVTMMVKKDGSKDMGDHKGHKMSEDHKQHH